jgi:acetyltransferase-like isoleucine patch superfamily enzyme
MITVEQEVGIGPAVQILTSTHRDPGHQRPIMDGELQRAPVFIGRGSDIGAGSIILPGVRIGRGVQVGAGSVVTADVPDLAVAAGVPARIIGTRDP